ncbi:MAG: hypothetical protein ACO1N4_01335 [Pedobacter sp.]
MDNFRLKEKLILKNPARVASVAILQKDEPAQQLPLVTTVTTVEQLDLKSQKIDPKTKPFFLYPKDGLYGLL